MDCRACHASGSGAAAEPGSGWVWNPDPERDYRLNILRLHDDLARRRNHLPERACNCRLQRRRALRHRHRRRPLDPLRDLPRLERPARHRNLRHPGADAGGARPPRRGPGPADRDDPRRRRQPLGLLPLPPRLRHPLSQRRHGQRRGFDRGPRHAVPELPRLHERGRQREPRGLARGADLPELPHRNGGPQQRPDPLHRRLRPAGSVPRGGRRSLRHRPRCPGDRLLALPLLRGSRRSPVLRLPRLDPRDLPLLARQRQHPDHGDPVPRGNPRRVLELPRLATQHDHRRPARHAPAGRRLGRRSPRRGQHDRLPRLPRRRLPRHRAVTIPRRSHPPHRRFRHQEPLAGIPDRLLPLPQRPRQRGPDSPTHRRW